MLENLQYSRDFFLKNRLEILQLQKGYRAGIDAVLLAAAAENSKSTKICELGAGVGTAILSLLKRKIEKTENLHANAIEIDESAFAFLCQNIKNNGMENIIAPFHKDGMVPNKEIENKFDLVISNPPFFDDNSKIRDPDIAKQKAYIIGAPLLKWLKAMLRLCHAKGEILLIHRADRMYDILKALEGRAGDIRILPIHPKTFEPANRILIRAKKASKAPTILLPPLYLRDRDAAQNYFKEIDEMCNGAALPIFNGLWE